MRESGHGRGRRSRCVCVGARLSQRLMGDAILDWKHSTLKLEFQRRSALNHRCNLTSDVESTSGNRDSYIPISHGPNFSDKSRPIGKFTTAAAPWRWDRAERSSSLKLFSGGTTGFLKKFLKCMKKFGASNRSSLRSDPLEFM